MFNKIQHKLQNLIINYLKLFQRMYWKYFKIQFNRKLFKFLKLNNNLYN